MSVSAVDAIQSEGHYLTNVVLRTTKLNQDGWCVKIFVHRVTYSIRDFLIKNLCIIYTSFELFEIYFFFLFYIFGISISISILISQFKRARPFTKWKFLSTNNNCSDKWPRDCHLTYRHEIEWSFFSGHEFYHLLCVYLLTMILIWLNEFTWISMLSPISV